MSGSEFDMYVIYPDEEGTHSSSSGVIVGIEIGAASYDAARLNACAVNPHIYGHSLGKSRDKTEISRLRTSCRAT